MKTNILKLWVRALRSGRYKQGREQLKKLNGKAKFCCLGVLCDLHAKAGKGQWDDDSISKTGLYLGEKWKLPLKVRRWAGLKDSNPTLDESTDQSAAELNDNGERFKAIAKLIEQAQKKKLI